LDDGKTVPYFRVKKPLDNQKSSHKMYTFVVLNRLACVFCANGTKTRQKVLHLEKEKLAFSKAKSAKNPSFLGSRGPNRT
jgi:hypothetical protein